MDIVIKEIDSVLCKVNKPALIKQSLKITKKYWKAIKNYRVGQQAFYGNGRAYLKTIAEFKNIKQAEAKLNELKRENQTVKYGMDTYTRKEERSYPAYLVDKDGYFFSGFKNRVIAFCKTHDIDVKIEEKTSKLKAKSSSLKGMGVTLG